MKILLVDDDAIFRKILAEILAKDGHEILHADSGDEALSILSEWSGVIDAIVTDMQMPLMTGVELLEKLEQLGLQIPCLLHSSDEFGTVPGKGRMSLRHITTAYPFARFHSKMERRYVQAFLAELAGN